MSSSCGDPSDEYCAGVLSRLYEYIDGELPPAGHDEMRQHLDDCAPCLAEHDLEAAIKALMARACGERAPEALRVRILARIAAAKAGRPGPMGQGPAGRGPVGEGPAGESPVGQPGPAGTPHTPVSGAGGWAGQTALGG